MVGWRGQTLGFHENNYCHHLLMNHELKTDSRRPLAARLDEVGDGHLYLSPSNLLSWTIIILFLAICHFWVQRCEITPQEKCRNLILFCNLTILLGGFHFLNEASTFCHQMDARARGHPWKSLVAREECSLSANQKNRLKIWCMSIDIL